MSGARCHVPRRNVGPVERDDERFHAVPGQVPQAGNCDRQPGAEQPVAVAGDRPEHRLDSGPRDRRAGRRDRPDHARSRRQGPAGMPRGGPGARPRLLPPAPRAIHGPTGLRRRRGRRPRPGRDPRRPGDRPGRLHRLGPARPVLSPGPAAGLFRVVGQVLKPEGTFNQITELPWVYWRFYRRISRTSSSSSSPATCRRPAPISAGGSNRSPDPR